MLCGSVTVMCFRPPHTVQTVLTAVAIMLGQHEPTWAEVRRVSHLQRCTTVSMMIHESMWRTGCAESGSRALGEWDMSVWCITIPFIAVVTIQVISKADFISTVVNFDTNSLSNPVIKTVEDVFKSAENLNAETVTRASKACGPLYQVSYLR